MVDRSIHVATVVKHLVDPSSLFLAFGTVAFEHHPVSRLDRALQTNLDPVARDAGHLAQQHALFRGTQARDQLLVIGPVEPTVRKAA